MPRRKLQESTCDAAFKNISGDPDGATLGLRPFPTYEVREKPGFMAFETRSAQVFVDDLHEHYNRAFRIGLTLPGAESEWTMVADSVTGCTCQTNVTKKLKFTCKVVKRWCMTLGLELTAKPPAASYQLGLAADGDVTAAVNAAGQLEFRQAGKAFLTLGTWTGRDALGANFRTIWRVTGGNIFIDFNQADYDAATYPVVMT